MKIEQLKTLLKDCETMVRQGEIRSAREKLSALNTAQIPRPMRLDFANLCRRCEMINHGLRILGPLMARDAGRFRGEANSREQAEYAVLLLKHGAVREALWTLKLVDEAEAPESHLYKAFCHFPVWEYEEALVALQRYQAIETRPYQRLVGRVNLAAALVGLDRRHEAKAVLDECIAEAESGGNVRLQSNCLQLRARLWFQSEDLSAAKRDAQESGRLMSANLSWDRFLVQKWMAIIEAFQARDQAPIERFRAEAIRFKQWESVREADRFALRLNFDQQRFSHLLFGTPFAAYRRDVRREHGNRPADSFFLLGGATGVIYDLKLGRFAGPQESPPSKVHALIEILLRDFYRPLAIGGLFAELYPDEHFDPENSVHRVSQVIYRARKWIEDNGLGLTIEETDGCYFLTIDRDLGVLIPFERASSDSESVRLDRLRADFGGDAFSPAEGCQALNLSASALRSLLSWAVAHGRAERIGSGPGTRYVIVEPHRVQKSAA